MTNRSDRGSAKPRGAERCERVDLIRDPICGLYQGQQACRPAQTGRTHGCTRPVRIAIEIPCTAEAVHTWLNGQIIAHYGGAEAVHSIRSLRKQRTYSTS